MNCIILRVCWFSIWTLWFVFLFSFCCYGKKTRELIYTYLPLLPLLSFLVSLSHVFTTSNRLEQARNDKQHLRILLDELGPAPAQVPRKENRTIDLPLYSRWEMPIQDITTALMAENNVTQNDILYMETKSIFVQLIRSIPQLAERRPILLPAIAERAATAKDAMLVQKGIKVKEMLRELEELRLVEKKDGYKLLTEEVATELVHLGNLREKVVLETRSLESVYKTIGDHNNYLRSQLEQYKAYLQNVRQTSGSGKGGKSSGVGVVSVAGKESKPVKSQLLGPFKFTHAQFEKDGIIVETNVPENRFVFPPCFYFSVLGEDADFLLFG